MIAFPDYERESGDGKSCARSRSTLIAALAFIAALSACAPEKPAMPSYATDVRPIFLAHCTRCHGAGGTLNVEDGGIKATPPRQCHLDVYDDEPNGCAVDGGMAPTCTMGAHSCAVTPWWAFLPTMPPAPATLNDWERDVLIRWGQNPLP